jgi:hypothetical protein
VEYDVSGDFQIIQLDIEIDALRKLPNRQRNQLVGCMHAHNELAALNRILMFSLNDVGEGELHNDAHGVQMWCLLQVLIGKLFETWNMLGERFLKANPEDVVVAQLSADHKKNLTWLKDYFGLPDQLKETPLRTIRDKTAFHYDKLNLDQAVDNLVADECRVYLARHPANTVYYAGSALVFRTVFAAIADKTTDTANMTSAERMKKGVEITLAHVNEVNLCLHNVLYGLIEQLLNQVLGKPAEAVGQLRIQVLDAPKPTRVALPMFVDIGEPSEKP